MFTKHADFSKHYKGNFFPFTALFVKTAIWYNTQWVRKLSEYNSHKTVKGEQFKSFFLVYTMGQSYLIRK